MAADKLHNGGESPPPRYAYLSCARRVFRSRTTPLDYETLCRFVQLA